MMAKMQIHESLPTEEPDAPGEHPGRVPGAQRVRPRLTLHEGSHAVNVHSVGVVDRQESVVAGQGQGGDTLRGWTTRASHTGNR